MNAYAEKWYNEERWKFRNDQNIYRKMKKLENNPKYRGKIDYFWGEQSRTRHEKTAWQNEYVRTHGNLMGSRFAWYYYQKNKPKDYPLSVKWQGF